MVDPYGLDPLEMYAAAEGEGTNVIHRAIDAQLSIWAYSFAAGSLVELEPGHVAGWSLFLLRPRWSVGIFCESYEPFGQVWPNPQPSTVLDWVEHWRECNLLTPDASELAEQLRRLHPDPGGPVVTPVYGLMVKREDAQALSATRRVRASAPALEQSADWAPPDVMTTSEVARYLRLDPGTLRRWRSESKGPPWMKLGDGPSGSVRYRRVAVEEWLRQQEGPGHGPAS